METTLKYRKGSYKDLEQLKKLGISSFGRFKPELSTVNWEKMKASLGNDATYTELLDKATAFVCTHGAAIVGMAFLVRSGNPTDLYPADTSYIRLVGVDPAFGGRGIAKTLTRHCI